MQRHRKRRRFHQQYQEEKWARDPATLEYLRYFALIEAHVDEPEPFGGNIDTLLHPRQLPTLGRIERLIGCCQGKFSNHLRAGSFLQTPEPCVGKIDTLLHRQLPTRRRSEKLIGCCQGILAKYLRSG